LGHSCIGFGKVINLSAAEAKYMGADRAAARNHFVSISHQKTHPAADGFSKM
jgi:hypothetical protein